MFLKHLLFLCAYVYQPDTWQEETTLGGQWLSFTEFGMGGNAPGVERLWSYCQVIYLHLPSKPCPNTVMD